MTSYDNIEIRGDGEVRVSQMRVGQITLDQGFALMGFEGEWQPVDQDDEDRIDNLEAQVRALGHENRQLEKKLRELQKATA